MTASATVCSPTILRSSSKVCIRFVRTILLAAVLLFVTLHSSAQQTTLYEFLEVPQGFRPENSLVSDGTYLYGMTTSGGGTGYFNEGDGVVYKVKPDGTEYQALMSFGGANGRSALGSLIIVDNYLYGMTYLGGGNDDGIIFRIMTDGTNFQKLLDFNETTTGGNPAGTFYYDGTFLYGTTYTGGGGFGTIFKIMPDGTGFQTLHVFIGSNGRGPDGTLIPDDSDPSFMYGTTSLGGATNFGVIYKIRFDGTGFTIIHHFDGTTMAPIGTLTTQGSSLYGVTLNGGATSAGTIFSIQNDGTNYTTLHNFDGAGNGGFPQGGLMLVNDTLYGMTSLRGVNNLGIIFRIKSDGTFFEKLMDFDGDNGADPRGSFIFEGSFLYGITNDGGSGGWGTIFKIMPDGSAHEKIMDYYFDPFGSGPHGDLFYDGNFLYGMTQNGGKHGLGVIFKLMPDGTGFVKMLDFDGFTTGSLPQGAFISDGTYLYATTLGGGDNDMGTIFRILPDGTGFEKLFDFDGPTNGMYPYSTLLLEGGFLYGTTYLGGSNDMGTIFKMMPDGSSFNKIHNFDSATGRYCFSSLLFEGGFLFGMTRGGGADDLGTIFKILPDGTGYDNIFDFDGASGNYPSGSLISDGSFLYGMTENGGVNDFGVIFKIEPDGTDFDLLHEFELTPGFFPHLNGAYPTGSLLLEGGVLYGMTPSGGSGDGEGDAGIFFWIRPDGTRFEKIFDFTFGNGALPYGSFISDGTSIYGMTSDGGGSRDGVVFKYTPASISITLQPSDNIVCPDDVATFTTSATGTTNITYQWQFSPDDIVYTDISNDSYYSNVTTATLSVSTIGDFGEGRYRCRINGDLAAEVFTNDEGLFFDSPGNCSSNQAPVIEASATGVTVAGIVTIDLLPLISDPDGNLDPSTLSVVGSTSQQGASASINSSSELILDYGGVLFTGTDQVTIEVCDLVGVCTQQLLTVEVVGDIEVYNAVSANGDDLNQILHIRYIADLPDTQNNHVTIYNRWGDVVFEISDYNNTDRAFRGKSDNGKDLPPGTYFYKIEFSSGRKAITGFLSLKR